MSTTTTDNSNFPSVEDLKQQLLRRKITKVRFRIPLSEERTERLLIAAYSAEVEYRQEKFSPDEPTQKNIKRVSMALTESKPKFGLLLCGVPGNGKTTMVYALQNTINYLSDNHVFDSMYQYEDERNAVDLPIIDAREVVESSKNYQGFVALKRKPFLAVEDIGREPTEVLEYGNVLNPVIDLLEYRYANQLFTVVSTNLTPKQVREKYGNRIADRFNEMMSVVIFGNNSYRGKNINIKNQ
jgi:DNA replication protein DnaC